LKTLLALLEVGVMLRRRRGSCGDTGSALHVAVDQELSSFFADSAASGQAGDELL